MERVPIQCVRGSESAGSLVNGLKERWVPARRDFFLILAAYFTLFLVLRTLVSETAGIDESDQVVLGQRLSWGYGPQPPLYTWLMTLFFQVFGSSEFTLTLLRELMLFGVYVLAYFNGRTVTGSHAGGVAAAVALQFNHSLVWEAQRDLNHSILTSLMVLALLLLFFRLRPGRWAGYVLFGICGGLLVLSKYNGVMVYIAMLLAALSLPGRRSLVLDRRMGVALGLSLLVVSPNLAWIFNHRDSAFSLVYKFGIKETMSWGQAVPVGLLNLLLKTAGHLATLAVTFAAIFWRPIFFERRLRAATPETKFLARTLLVIAGMAVLSVVCFKVTAFKDRWFQPLFIAAPIFLIAALREELSARRLRVLLWLGLGVALVVATLAPGRILLTERLGKREILNAPFRKFAPKLSPLVQEADFIVAENRWLAGNLRLQFPGKIAISPELVAAYAPAARRCLLVWEVKSGPDLPPRISELARRFGSGQPGPWPVFFEETWKYHRTRKMRLGTMLLSN